MTSQQRAKAHPFPKATGTGWPIEPNTKTSPKVFQTKEWPQISIVTPSYNQGDFLEKTIRSVLLQGYPNLQYIVIDGGSTDHSVDIIKKYEPWIDFWVSEKDRGQSHAINKGLEKATGELLGWLNSDDYFTPGALLKFALAYLEDQSAGAIYGHGQMADTAGNIVYNARTAEVTLDNLFDWYDGGAEFTQPSCLFTRKAWNNCGPLAEDLHYAMDIDLWIKIAKKYRFKFIEELLSISLRHDNAKTCADAEKSFLDLAMVYTRHGREDKARVVLNKQILRLFQFQQDAEHYRHENEILRRENTGLKKVPIFGTLANIINMHRKDSI